MGSSPAFAVLDQRYGLGDGIDLKSQRWGAGVYSHGDGFICCDNYFSIADIHVMNTSIVSSSSVSAGPVCGGRATLAHAL
jgi:hypothetical protein